MVAALHVDRRMVRPEKGWFKVAGIRPEGDRTLEEQMMGLAPALTEAKGKTVLDLGCAEACISAEFAKAGALDVLGIELLETHLAVARRVCQGLPQVRFICANLKDYIPEHPDHPKFDIVLALGIIHKLPDPAVPLRWAAGIAKDLLLFRGPGRDALKNHGGVIAAKHTGTRCDVPKVMTECGFTLERVIDGVRGEAAHYWRRK